MAIDISNVQCKLVGLSCLGDKVRDQVKREWDKQFYEHEAFWLDVEPNQTTATITERITNLISGQGIVSLAGKTVLVSIFMDLTCPFDENMCKELVDVPEILANVLGCNVPVTLEFCYLARMAFADKNALCNNVESIVAVNQQNTKIRKQVCLVAKSPLIQEENDHNWKAVLTLLDVLRREPNPLNVMPVVNPTSNTSVGFIRYGEYDQVMREQLDARKICLSEELTDRGEKDLVNILNNAKAEIINEIEKKYVVDANAHPIHSDMKVDGCFARRRAARGRNDQYEHAKHSTYLALIQTAENLQNMIMKAYSDRICKAGEYLEDYLRKAKVGVELEANKCAMERILAVEESSVRKPSDPMLSYKESGCSDEIQAYLNGTRRYAAEKVKRAFEEALLKAYHELPEAYFDRKRTNIKMELELIDIQQSALIERSELIACASQGDPLPETCFHPILGGGTMTRMMLCRTGKDVQECDSACKSQATNVYFVDEKFGGIRTLDNAPIKALQVLMFDYTSHLRDLIK